MTEKENKIETKRLQNINDIMARQMGPKVEVSNEEYEQLGNENQNNQQSEKEILKEKRKELIKRFNFELNLIQVKKQELILQKNEINNEKINKQINELNNYEKKLKEDIPYLSGISEYLGQSKFFNGIKNHQKIVKSIKNILDKLSIQTTLKGINDHINILEEELKNSNINEKLKNDLIEKIEEKRKIINENNMAEIKSKIIIGTNNCIIKPYELGKNHLKILENNQKLTSVVFKQTTKMRPKCLANIRQNIAINELNKNEKITKNTEQKQNNETKENNINKSETKKQVMTNKPNSNTKTNKTVLNNNKKISNNKTDIFLQKTKEEKIKIKKENNNLKKARLNIFKRMGEYMQQKFGTKKRER